MNDQAQPTAPAKSWRKTIRIVIFVAIAITLSLVTFNTVSGLVTTWDITSLPGLALVNPTPTPDGDQVALPGEIQEEAGSESTSKPVGLTPDPWDGASRVTVLVMGLDYNDWRAGEGPPRTDTMILLTVDPLSNTAGILSIPRDLWVSIPGFDYGKINQAYQLGESFKVPGGGPALAMSTVEHLIGVPIQYYAQIDFDVFVQFIDEVHGVKLSVPEEIFVDIYDDDKGKIRISEILNKAKMNALGIKDTMKLQEVSKGLLSYLRYHQENVFAKGNKERSDD